MSNNELLKYSAKIKDVYFELKDYKFFHSPYLDRKTKKRFIGRKKVKNRVVSILQHTDTKSGSYLITGFRGMGKTSVVREALESYNAEQENQEEKEIFNTLNLALEDTLKLLRIFLCYVFGYNLIQYVFSGTCEFQEFCAGLYQYFTSESYDFTFYSKQIELFAGLICFLFITLVFTKLENINWKFFQLLSFDKIRETMKKSGKRKLFHLLNFNQFREKITGKLLQSIIKIFIFIVIAISGIYLLLELLRPATSEHFPPIYFFYKNILFVVFILQAVLSFSSNKLFESFWNAFRMIFLVYLVVVISVFFLNYPLICREPFCPSRVSRFMELFFPVLNSKSDSLSVFFRIIWGVFFSYLILSNILFAIDFIFLVRLRIVAYLRDKLRKIIAQQQMRSRGVKIEKSRKYDSFEINLSQDGLDELDVLRRITIALESYWLRNKYEFGGPSFNRRFYSPWRMVIAKINRPRRENVEPSYSSVLAKLSLLRNRIKGQVTSKKELKIDPQVKTKIAGGWLGDLTVPLGSYSTNDEVVYPIANAKEAEDQLISILDDIDTLREKEGWDIPYFAFIIDELDKIEPHNISAIQEKESANPILDKSIYAQDTNRFRQRREAVARLLANLKGFLNVVPAKFFFIGGREMFDADLADIADRESFYSSIFNDVIYVESFFKDSIDSVNPDKGGITQMTEAYISNIILGELSEFQDKNRQTRDLSLKRIYSLLASPSQDQKNSGSQGQENSGQPLIIRTETENSEEFLFHDAGNNFADEVKKQKYKAIFTLQNYVIYLTYRSNGTPKKLTGLTEQLIVRGPKNNNQKFFTDNLVILHQNDEGKDFKDFEELDLSKKLFLKFNFTTQYEIGLTSNLYRPYLIANSRHLKELGDKLLFSSSFIIDHLLKFHPFGFSWRTLELIPEVVLINREPNLREFIEDLMRFYSLNYIRDTVSGIFDYRFRSIIRRELVYISKTSDLGSAAFNFTLDESLATKRHYKRKLIELREKYANYSPLPENNQYIHSIGFVQTILGDLHFYDKEYDEAVIFYTESIQTLRLPNAISKRLITRHQFLLWLRNKLKLGLTLEKMRAFDTAFSLYKTLVLDTERYFKHIVSKESEEEQKEAAKEVTVTEEGSGELIDNKTRKAEDHRTIQLVSMPFIALLAVTEKARNDGLTYTNLFSNREDFLRTINAQRETINKYHHESEEKDNVFDLYRKYFLMADYYNNVGSLLYYKNCQFSKFFSLKKKDYWLDAFTENSKSGKKTRKVSEADNSLISQQQKLYQEPLNREYDYFPSLTSFNYYWNSLYFLLRYHRQRLKEKIEKKTECCPQGEEKVLLQDNLLALCAAYLLPECVDMISSNRFYYLAHVVSKIGDSILASLRKEQICVPKERFNALDITDPEKDSLLPDKAREKNIKRFRELVGDGESLFSIETVLYIYKLAAALYKRSGHNSYYASHLIKILYVVKDLIEINKSISSVQLTDLKSLLIDFLGDGKGNQELFSNMQKIAETVFRATTWNNEVSNRPQILKYREIFDIAYDRDKDRELIYNNLNNITANQEVIVLVEGIKLKLRQGDEDFIADFTFGKSIISAYGSINSRYQRMIELKYRTERCYFILRRVLKLKSFCLEIENNQQTIDYDIQTLDSIKENLGKIIGLNSNSTDGLLISDVLAFVIQDALFCSRELIKMIRLYNPGYVIGFSFMAEAHSRMGDWCQAYENYLNILDGIIENEITSKFDDILGQIPPAYQLQKADQLKKIDGGIRNLNQWLLKSRNMMDDKFEADLRLKIDEIKKEIISLSGIQRNTILPDVSKILEWKQKKIFFQNRIEELLGTETLLYMEPKNHFETAVQYYYKMIQLHSDGKTYKDKLHELYMLEDDYNDVMAHYTIASERLRINTGKIRLKISDLNKKIQNSRLYQYQSYLASTDASPGTSTPLINDQVIDSYYKFFSEGVT